MPLGWIVRSAIVGAAVQVAVNVGGLVTLLSPLPPDPKSTVLLWVFILTGLADAGIIGYLLWVPPTPPAPPLPAHHLSRGAIKAGLYSGTLALIFTLVAIFILRVPLGLGFTTVTVLLGIFLLLTLVQDVVASVVVLRR